MSMVTQCPHCSTAFNVTPEQLFKRDGRVRCGTCREVFDGLVQLTSLEALEAGTPPPLADSSDAQSRADAADTSVEARPAPAHGFAPLNWPMVPEVPVVPMPPKPNVAAVDASETAALPLSATAVPQPVNSLATAAEPAPSPRRRGWWWAAAATLAALTLCAQLLYGLRSEIAAYVPSAKPLLVHLCGWADCNVPALQRPSALEVQASDLLILDNAKPHLVQLVVTLHNRSGLEVAYPALDLVLNDRFEHAVARRVLLPAEYLRKPDAHHAVIAASVTATLRVDLDVSGLAAGGFQLLLIPAPQT